jgi:hypothetical protein
VNWWHCCWTELAGREFIWTLWNEKKEENAWKLVWWKGLSRPPFIGQGREREDINEQEWPAMKVLQIDH